MKATETAALIAAGAGFLTAIGAMTKQLVDGWRAMRSGKARDERVKNRTLLDRMQAAECDADEARRIADVEASYRRVLSEYASALRRLLIEHGVPERIIPPWPARPE